MYWNRAVLAIIMISLFFSCKKNCDNINCSNGSVPNEDCICLCTLGYTGVNCDDSFANSIEGEYVGFKQCFSDVDSLQLQTTELSLVMTNAREITIVNWDLKIELSENMITMPLQNAVNSSGEAYEVSGNGTYGNNKVLMNIVSNFGASRPLLTCNYELNR